MLGIHDHTRQLPIKVLQFGEGNFLRGFVDWMIHRMNEQDLFLGQAVVVQPIPHGLVDVLNEQKGRYTLLLRGMLNGNLVEEAEVITSIRQGVNPYTEYAQFLQYAELSELRVIVSNTTEAGIVLDENDQYTDAPPVSFPGKLTVFLHKRFQAFQGAPDKAVIILPCELIDRNGDELKQIVHQLAQQWALEPEFFQWLEHCHFLNTLVDRIVTGYPKDEIEALTEELGYDDRLLNTAEPFHLWVIEGDARLATELPFTEAGLNVVWTNDLSPYRTRKVRILNGAHTLTALAAYLAGVDTVKECMDDEMIFAYMKKGLYNEIIPTLDLPEEELKTYSASVLERFSNPFIKHFLLSIALNSISKYKTRILPSLVESIVRTGSAQDVLSFSLAALIRFYRIQAGADGFYYGDRGNGEQYLVQDDLDALQACAAIWSEYGSITSGCKERTVVHAFLSHKNFWGCDLTQLPGLVDQVTVWLKAIQANGMRHAMRQAAGVSAQE